MLNKRPLYLLIVSPVLIAIQFVVGIVLVQKIIVVNNEQKINSKLETYLRNNMVYLINAETGQRGYLLTGDLKYLEPYNFAVEKTKENDLFLSSFASNDQIQQLAEIKQKGENKLRELALTIALAQSGKRDSAMIVIKENFGKLTMDSIRKITNEFLGKAVEIIMTDQEAEYRLIYIFLGSMVALFLFHLFFWYYAYERFKEYSGNMTDMLVQQKKSNVYFEQFAFISAHDLKAPIITIQGLVNLLIKSKGVKDEYGQLLLMLKSTADEMQRTNHSLNHILRLRQNLLRKPEDAEEFKPLKIILEEVIAILQTSITTGEVDLQLDLDGVADVMFPHVHVRSLFHNLLSNAIKYSDPQRKAQIRIKTGKEEDGAYRIVVEDNGIGINLDLNREKMFGIFKRFHTHVEGAGIGLHIVKSIVDAYDGSIDVISQPGKGTRFEIILYTPSN